MRAIIYACIFLTGTACSPSAPPAAEIAPNTNQHKATHDGRFNSRCNASTPGERTAYFCRLSMYQLLANPEKYDGLTVNFVAYAAPVANRMFLFPTESAFAQLDLSSAVEIRPIPTAIDTNLAGRWIRAKGKFSADVDGPNYLTFGTLSQFSWE